jgi:hypothetical protein
MAAQKIKVYLHKHKWNDTLIPMAGDMSDEHVTCVGVHEFDYEIPADFDPVAAEVKALNKELNRLTDKHLTEVRRLKGRIAELLCLENKVES